MPPSQGGDDLKEILRWSAEEGVGRSADHDGKSIGPWNPELLAEAISKLETNAEGIDLRTVQLWFEDNDRGVSQENIHRLASIFGCGDDQATRDWRIALRDAKLRLKSVRRAHRARSSTIQRLSLALRSHAIFQDQNTLNLSVVLWAGCALIGFLASILGVHSITYSPKADLEKQVGFLWAPNWTLLQLVFLPLFLMVVANLMTFWEETGRPSLEPQGPSKDNRAWISRIESYNASHWAIFVICFALVFLLQWVGMYFRPIVLGDAGNQILDWSNITTVRPEVMSVTVAVMLSMISFMYAGLCVFLFLTGLLFLYTISRDFFDLCNAPEFLESKGTHHKVRAVGGKLILGIFRCTILGILIATCIKVYVVFLKSEGQNILRWVIDDLLMVLNLRAERVGWLGNYALGDFSSFLLVFTTCFVFFVSMLQIHRVFVKFSSSEASERADFSPRVSGNSWLNNFSWLMLVGVILLLIANFLFVGQFAGFSVLLLLSVIVAAYCLINPLIEL